MTTRRTSYFKGYKIQHTGKTETLYGGEFDVWVYVEGPNKGKTVYTPVDDPRYAR